MVYENVILVSIIILGLVIGAKKIPEIAKNLGKTKNEFKKGLQEK